MNCSRLTKTKENWAKARRGGEEREVFYEGDDRLPPGQHLVETGLYSTLAKNLTFRSAEWTLTIGGTVTTPVTWTWAGISCATAIQRCVRFSLRDVLESLSTMNGKGSASNNSDRRRPAASYC